MPGTLNLNKKKLSSLSHNCVLIHPSVASHLTAADPGVICVASVKGRSVTTERQFKRGHRDR